MDAHKVLIVDDEESNRFVMCECLEDEAYILVEAFHGQQALEMIEQEQPDVVLLDIMMPGLDGMAVLKILQEQKHTCHIPVIMVTAIDARSASLDAGAIDHIVKPFSGSVLRDSVRSALRNGATFGSSPNRGGKLDSIPQFRRRFEKEALEGSNQARLRWVRMQLTIGV